MACLGWWVERFQWRAELCKAILGYFYPAMLHSLMSLLSKLATVISGMFTWCDPFEMFPVLLIPYTKNSHTGRQHQPQGSQSHEILTESALPSLCIRE